MVTDSSPCRLIVASLGPRRHEPVPHLAYALNITRQHVAGPEPAWRGAAQADPGRRAGEDQVAGQQRGDRRQLLDQVADAEDHLPGAGLLHLVTVDRAAQLQIVRVIELVRSDQPGADRPEAG